MSPIPAEPPSPSRGGSSLWMTDGESQWGSQGLVAPEWHILHKNWSTHFLRSPSNQLKPKVRIRDHSPQHMLRRCSLSQGFAGAALLMAMLSLVAASASRSTTSTIQAYLFPLCSPIIEVPCVEPDGWAKNREGMSARVWAENSWLSLCPLTAPLYRARSVYCQAISGGEKKNNKKTKRFQNNMHCLSKACTCPQLPSQESLLSSFCWKQLKLKLT